MNPALSSPSPTTAIEFGYCPRTPISSAVNVGPRISTEVPEVHCSPSLSPSRKKSRFFESLRMRSPRNANIADENGSPRALTKRKSIADILPFSSTRSRKPPVGGHVYHSFHDKRSKSVFPAKEKAILRDASASQLNRRKSIGEIWGSISHKVSSRRSVMLRHRPAGMQARFNDDRPDPVTSVSGTLSTVTQPSSIRMDERIPNNASTRPQQQSVDSGADVDIKKAQKFSISSSSLWYKESPGTPAPINRDGAKTPDSYLNLLIEVYNNLGEFSDPRTPDFFEKAHSPFWTDSTQVEDEDDKAEGDSEGVEEDEEEFSLPPPYSLHDFSNTNLGQIEFREDPPLEHSDNPRFRDMLPGVTVRNVDPLEKSPTIDRQFPDIELGQIEIPEYSPFEPASSIRPQGTLDRVEALEVDPLEESPKIDPQLGPIDTPGDSQFEQSNNPHRGGTVFRIEVRDGDLLEQTPNVNTCLRDVELEHIEFREDSGIEDPNNSRALARKVPGANIAEESPNIDLEFPLRGGDRSQRYQQLMRKPGPSPKFTNEIIEKSIKLTVEKMTKNFYMASSSEECSEDDAKNREEYSFETDQTEVWDSVIMGSRILQQTKPFRPLKSIPSSEALGISNPPVEQVLQESVDLRNLAELASTQSIPNDSDLVPTASTSLDTGKLERMQPSSQRRRETSSTMVRVEFPKTVNLGAHTEMYESKSKAIAALYEYKLSELSNFCTYDSSTNTIFAHALESSVPNPAVLRQAGLDILWLPMQKDIAQMIQEKVKTEDKTELPLIKKQSSVSVGEETNLELTRENTDSDVSRPSLDLDSLSAHNEGMLAENLFNFGQRGSQFEPEAEFIGPRSLSSSLELDPASLQHEEETSIFDDDFFIETGPDMARSFLGSQYYEESRSGSPNGTRLSPSDLFGAGLDRDLLWSVDDYEEVKPVKTWAELGREYLAEHPPQTIRDSDDDHKPMDDGSEYSALRNDIIPSRKSSLAENPPQTIRNSEDDHKPTNEESGYFVSQSGIIPSRKSSWEGPSMEHIEVIGTSEKIQTLRGRFARRSGLLSILANEDNFILRTSKRRRRRRSWSKSPGFAESQINLPQEDTKEDILDLVTMDAGTPPTSSVGSIRLSGLSEGRNSTGCENSEIPFPADETRCYFSPQSSVSYTSYIEGERARERLYQTSPLIAAFRIEAEEACEAVTEIFLGPKHSAGGKKYSSEMIDSEPRILDNVGSQPESRDSQHIQGKTKIENEGSSELTDCRGSSVISPASGFGFMAYSKQMAFESTPEKSKIRNEDSGEHTDGRRSSGISLASGFRFTEYSKQMVSEEDCQEDGPMSNSPASEDSGSTIGLHRLETMFDSSIPTSNDYLTGNNGDSLGLEFRKMTQEPACDEPASAEIKDADLFHSPRYFNQISITPWKVIIQEDLNLRAIGKAARENCPAKHEGKKIRALVDIFQARGLMQSTKPVLQRKQSPVPFLHQSSGLPTTPTTRIITPTGNVYQPSGTVCVTAGRPLLHSPIRRVPTPHSPIIRPSSGLSSLDTDVSELLGEQLDRVEKHLGEDDESGPNEEISV